MRHSREPKPAFLLKAGEVPDLLSNTKSRKLLLYGGSRNDNLRTFISLPCLARFSGSQSEGLVTTWRKRRPQCHLNTLSWMHSWLGASMLCGLRIRRNVKTTSTCDFNILFRRQLYMLFPDSDFRSWMTSRSRCKEDSQTVR